MSLATLPIKLSNSYSIEFQVVRHKHGKAIFEVLTRIGSVTKYRDGKLGFDNVLFGIVFFVVVVTLILIFHQQLMKYSPIFIKGRKQKPLIYWQHLEPRTLLRV